MAKPRPVPPVFDPLPLSTRKNRSVSRGMYLGSMPSPESFTENTPLNSLDSHLIAISPPSGEYFMALKIRFEKALYSSFYKSRTVEAPPQGYPRQEYVCQSR